MNGVTNVLGVELSQLTSDEERVGLEIEPLSIGLTGIKSHTVAEDIRELFQTPILRRAAIFMCVVVASTDSRFMVCLLH